MKRIRRHGSLRTFLHALGVAALLGVAAPACDAGGTVEIKSAELAPGGVYVAYNNKFSECSQGCDKIKKGDLILEIDGKPATTRADLAGMTSGQPVKLKVLRPSSKETLQVDFTATLSGKLAPIEASPPLWMVGAAKLDKAPNWARKQLFGHASPSIMLTNANGGILSGRQLYGKKHMLVLWDWATRQEQAHAVEILKVLQVAQEDLGRAGVDVLFTQIRFPGNTITSGSGKSIPRQAPMNDGQLRDFQTKYGDPNKPQLALYRFPNATEYNAALEVGLEGSTPYIQYLRLSPAIILLDEGGIVRWHSEGAQAMPPDKVGKIPSDMQYTVIEAVKFAQESL